MNINQNNAAEALEGEKLKNRWEVILKLPKDKDSTGGQFSVCYVVKELNTGEYAFLKALNFKSFFESSKHLSIVETVNRQTNAYKFERDLLLRCKYSRLSKVSMILDEGEVRLDNFMIGDVPYLIFEMAEGDARNHFNFAKSVDSSWKLRSLHNVAVGLMQLHKVKIGHQDLKPSNVLLFDNGIESKIGDLGRSLCADIKAPHGNGGKFTGDITYAPPEYLYNYIVPDWNIRVKSTDMYLLGSLIVFYFLGLNMTTLLAKNIDEQFIWDNWQGTYEEVRTYLMDSFYRSLEEFRDGLENKNLADNLYPVVKYCCHPYPEFRGHFKAGLRTSNSKLKQNYNQYDLQKTVSKLDYLAKKMRHNLL